MAMSMFVCRSACRSMSLCRHISTKAQQLLRWATVSPQ